MHAENYHTRVVGNRFKKKIEEDGLSKATKELMGVMGVTVEYEKEGNPQFLEMRGKLNSEPGIAISNHPGQYDALAILSALDRKDIMFMVAGNVYDSLASVFGESRIVEAKRKGKKEIVELLEKAQEHIRNGGLFIYFPTGGRETWSDNPRFEFFSSFRYLIERMKPTDMIYSLNINHVGANPENPGLSIERVVRESAFASGSGRENPTLNRLAKPFRLKIDENYSQVDEWKKAIGRERNNELKNKILTLNYLDKFNKSN